MSAFISLTLTPMMSARLLRHVEISRKGPIVRVTESVFSWVTQQYERSLRWVLDHQTATLVVAASTVVLTVLLYIAVPKGFFPVQDTGLVQVMTQGDPGISFAETCRSTTPYATRCFWLFARRLHARSKHGIGPRSDH